VLRSREPTQVSNSVIRPPSGHWLEGRSLLRISVISAAGLALAMVLFVCIPRVWVGSANPFSTRSEIGARPLTGFSAEVRLGQMGQILESTERVLQVRLIDNYTKNPISLDDFCRKHGTLEPMFRGSVLDLYSRGRWAAAGMGERNANLRPMQPQREGMIRQEYILDPIGTDVLFGMRPVTLGALRDPTQPVAVDLDSGTLTSMRGDTRERLTYRLYSAPAVPGQYRLDVVPPLYGMSRFAQRRCLEIPRERLPRLVALAEELVRPDRLPELPDESTERIKAAVLEGYFLEPQRFAYTLNMEVRDPTIDPVEDFLFNRRSGHCEYFASSLTLMLRAVDIPARLITGFKGAEYNSHTEYYEVQQRHAHAWVEAFIDGEWIVLDPTPGGRDESVRNIAASSGFWKNAKSSLNSLWSNYVVSLSYNRQKQEIYDPLQTTVTGGINTVRGRLDGVKELLQRIRLLIMSPDQWFSWQGLVFTFLLMTTTVLAVRTFRWFARLIRNRLQARRLGRQASRRRVAFYEQFLALMDSIGLRPGVAQTAQEFAETIRRELSSKAGLNGMAEFPERVARNFYRVRFAEQELAPGELDELKRQFDQFAAMLKSGKELRTA
jgi:protein-glutamine gamma-glutamyltransferase